MIEFFIAFVVFYLWHSLGISIGYHRVLSHGASEIPRPLLLFLLAGGYLAMQGAPVVWASVHRLHHQVSDTKLDLHSPLRGTWMAFAGWMMQKTNPNMDVLVPDLLEDKLLCWFGTGAMPSRPWLNLLCCIGWRILLLLLFGPSVAIASLLCWIIVFCLPQLINVLCHNPRLGYVNYKTGDNSRNPRGLFCFLSVGESLHNNHHRFPKTKNNAMMDGELDISGIILEKL